MPPVGAALVVFFAVAVPAMLLMAAWATVTALRILFPEEELPALQRGATGGVPVRLHDIVADQQARRARAATGAPGGDRAPASAGPRGHPLFDDLWLRRN